MKQYVTLSIDNFSVKAVKGESVLDAALQAGICIPHLCHVPVLKDVGACRLCIVEEVKNGRSKIGSSCTLNAEDGMIIKSNTDRIRKLRKNIAELMVAQAPNSRAIQDIAVRCGVKEVRYSFRNDNCVQCGRCVRYCAEYTKANALGFVGRGKNRHVEFALGFRRDLCKNCGFCIAYCPMSVTPCGSPMKPGEGQLCGQCESRAQTMETYAGACIRCELGKGFQCTRQVYG